MEVAVVHCVESSWEGGGEVEVGVVHCVESPRVERGEWGGGGGGVVHCVESPMWHNYSLV